MRRKRAVAALVVCAAAGLASAAGADPGQGRPVATGDISGKRFCFLHNGHEVVFGADGEATNRNTGKHWRWTVPQPGVVLYGRRKYLQVEVLENGTLHYSWFNSQRHGGHYDEQWARPCG